MLLVGVVGTFYIFLTVMFGVSLSPSHSSQRRGSIDGLSARPPKHGLNFRDNLSPKVVKNVSLAHADQENMMPSHRNQQYSIPVKTGLPKSPNDLMTKRRRSEGIVKLTISDGPPSSLKKAKKQRNKRVS